MLELFDILSTVKIFEIQAHTGTVWGLSLSPDKKLLATGGTDHEVKLWKIGSKRLKLTKVLSMKDEVLEVKYSPCGRYIAVGLIDYTIQILYADTNKAFIALYGHKLPVTCFDISYDSMLVASGSADKNLKIWGLDHGDCHRSIFAHDQALTDVKFVHETHFLFTASRDRLIKYWDADTFQCIMRLSGHMGEVWKIVISSKGDFIVSTGNDFSVRLWTQNEDQVFLE